MLEFLRSIRTRHIDPESFRDIRLAAGLTRAQLADRMGISVPTIAKWENVDGAGVKMDMQQYNDFLVATTEPHELEKLADIIKAEVDFLDERKARAKGLKN